MATITEDLINELKSINDIDLFFSKYEDKFINKKPYEYLNELLDIKGKSVADVSSASGKTDYVYKIFKGDRNPSRDILISIAFGLELSLEETQLLLRISKFAKLDSRDKRDSVIIYCISHSYSVFKTDDLLDEKDLPTLN